MSRKQGQKSATKSSNAKTEAASKNTDEQVQKNTPKQSITEKVGQKESKPLTLGQTEKIITKHGLELETDENGKRVYRKKKDLPVPEQGSQGSQNRITKMITTRIEPEFIDLFNKCAEQFPTKKEALQEAVKLLAEKLELD